MEILSYLAELIKTRKEVSISGLGTFFKKKSPGRYDVELHSFVPPTYTLDFTPEVREHHALMDHISRKKNISPDSANYFIEQFAASVQKQLSDQQYADLGEIGSLSVVAGNLVFNEGTASGIAFGSYGLPTIKDDLSLTTEQIPTPPPSEEQLTLEDHNADLSDGSGNFEDLHHEEKDLEEDKVELPTYQETPEIYEEKSNSGSKTIIIIIFAIIALIALAFLVKPDLFKGKDSAPVPADSVTINAPVLKTDTIPNEDPSKTILPADTLKDTTTIIAPPLDTLISYEIIAASLLNKKEADRFLLDMKKRGIPAKIAKMPGRRVKISIGTFVDEVTAKNELERLKASTKIPGIYIYPIKHTHKP